MERVPVGEKRLVIILLAQNPGPNLCKVIASAVALGYPAPVIVNWTPEQGADSTVAAQSRLAKISGVLDFLQWALNDNATGMATLEEDDSVLILDAYDVWLQLPPDVIIRNYFAANRRADDTVSRTYDRLADKDLLRQTIIVSAQKRCYALMNEMSNLHCDELPRSTLPDDVLCFFTDSTFFNYQYARPRYLNSGSFMGPAGDLQRYFQRANDRMEEYLTQSPSSKQLSGDQGIFAEVFWPARGMAEWSPRAMYRRALSTSAITDERVGVSYRSRLRTRTLLPNLLLRTRRFIRKFARFGCCSARVEGSRRQITSSTEAAKRHSDSTWSIGSTRRQPGSAPDLGLCAALCRLLDRFYSGGCSS